MIINLSNLLYNTIYCNFQTREVNNGYECWRADQSAKEWPRSIRFIGSSVCIDLGFDSWDRLNDMEWAVLFLSMREPCPWKTTVISSNVQCCSAHCPFITAIGVTISFWRVSLSQLYQDLQGTKTLTVVHPGFFFNREGFSNQRGLSLSNTYVQAIFNDGYWICMLRL